MKDEMSKHLKEGIKLHEQILDVGVNNTTDLQKDEAAYKKMIENGLFKGESNEKEKKRG